MRLSGGEAPGNVTGEDPSLEDDDRAIAQVA